MGNYAVLERCGSSVYPSYWSGFRLEILWKELSVHSGEIETKVVHARRCMGDRSHFVSFFSAHVCRRTVRSLIIITTVLLEPFFFEKEIAKKKSISFLVLFLFLFLFLFLSDTSRPIILR